MLLDILQYTGWPHNKSLPGTRCQWCEGEKPCTETGRGGAPVCFCKLALTARGSGTDGG